MPEQPFLVGANYWPRRKAMSWWSSFDIGEVRDEFAVLRALGLSMARIFLLWDDWQPTPDTVNQQALRDLIHVCDAAAGLHLALNITFFTGHMSGPNWAPRWLLLPNEPMPLRVRQVVSGCRVVDCGYRNPFTDPIALAAEELLLRVVVSELRQHPAVAIWNLGNEPDLFARPPNAAAGREWVRRMAGVIRAIDPDHALTCGLHLASLIEDNGLRVHDVFSEVDLPVMHAYPMYADWAASPLDPDFVPFTCALTAALCGKPALMEEFGGCTQAPGQPSGFLEWTGYGQRRRQFMASEEDLAVYVEQVLGRLVEVGAAGAVLWCFADYTDEWADRPPCDESRHERWFGLVRPDGSWKPHASVVQRFAAKHPRVQSPRRSLTLDVSPEEYYSTPLEHARRLYQRFRDERH